MKKLALLALFVSLALAACAPPVPTPKPTAVPTPEPTAGGTCFWRPQGTSSVVSIPKGGVEIGYFESTRGAVEYVSCDRVREEPVLTDTELAKLQREENDGYAVARIFPADGSIRGVRIRTSSGQEYALSNGMWVYVKLVEGGYIVDYGDIIFVRKNSVVFTAE